ncbi:hypothetical protein Tco_0453137 [Tanacetum coccineum]
MDENNDLNLRSITKEAIDDLEWPGSSIQITLQPTPLSVTFKGGGHGDLHIDFMYYANMDLLSAFNNDQMVFSTWMTFEGNTRDLASFGEETDEIKDLHQDSPRIMFSERKDGVTSTKRRRRDLFGDDVWISAMAS